MSTNTPHNNSNLLHAVNGRALDEVWPTNLQNIGLGMGCFWGVERLFWQQKGVYVTATGYQGGAQINPNYTDVCQHQTDHAESVRVVFDPDIVSLALILAIFWENHDPTQGDAQGNDIGGQYRSMIFAQNAQQAEQATDSLHKAQVLLDAKGFGKITTEIVIGAKFWLAEEEHQQYLAKNPGGYCNLAGTGIFCGAE